MPQFDENRQIHMYLPDDYIVSRKQYPVLYMFDGHNLFDDEDATYGKSWNLAYQIIEQKKDIIVVGQECSHQGNDRINEYSPYSFSDDFFGDVEGYGKETMAFFVHTLKPYIDAHFPTRRDRQYTWIGGSSCGGIMAYYALLAHSSVFSKAICISPFFAPMYEDLVKDTQNKYIFQDSKFYISWGAKEGGDHAFIYETKMCTELANILIHRNIEVQFNVRPEGRHCEEDWEKEAPDFLQFLFQE